MRSTEPTVARTEPLPRAGTGAVAQRTNGTEADAFTSTATTFADTRQTEPTGAKRIADRIAPHVAAGAHRVIAERVVATPGGRRRVRITTSTRVEEADHAEFGSLSAWLWHWRHGGRIG